MDTDKEKLIKELGSMGVYPVDDAALLSQFCRLCGESYSIDARIRYEDTTLIMMVPHPKFESKKLYNDDFCPDCLDALQAVVKRQQDIKKL